jgi:FKBP-type peptidyl-prolyl cis-trans isomerase
MRLSRVLVLLLVTGLAGVAACSKPAAEAPAANTPAPAAAPSAVPAPPDVAAPPADAIKTASGLASKVIKAGTGTIHPTATSTVKVHYSGWLTTGELFDSSVVRGEAIEFPLTRVIPGWTEGVQLMVIGEKRRFWIPESLAYNGQPGAPPGMLVFDIELLDIK